ncbi:MAG TPA: IPTL-CTERM sorting domain-containing protein, partial [Casimicrobiaceae bacterium]|nr:IPTL-CTERM sorting domain-containing protein [Casimicrobiaceae bacterium]
GVFGPGNNVDPVGAIFSWTVQGIASSNSTPIPTLSAWMLALLALLVGSTGALVWRQREA